MEIDSSKKQGNRKTLKIVISIVLVLAAVVVALTQDILMANFFAYRFCKAEPNPKTFIKRTVDFPESIYWEDNVYPGFDENDRLLMIRNYLDGVHLQSMAVNGPDGTIYFYTATAEDWAGSARIEKKTEQDWKDYFARIDEEAKIIAARGKVLTKKNLPKFNYSVVFNPVELTPLQQKYLYSDEVVVTDVNNNEVIGYNRRLMHRWYKLFPDIALGNRYYYPEAMCGYNSIIGFIYKTFIHFNKIKSGAIPESYNSKIFRKNNDGKIRGHHT